jgi:hypothetical protein
VLSVPPHAPAVAYSQAVARRSASVSSFAVAFSLSHDLLGERFEFGRFEPSLHLRGGFRPPRSAE